MTGSYRAGGEPAVGAVERQGYVGTDFGCRVGGVAVDYRPERVTVTLGQLELGVAHLSAVF